MLAQTSQEPGYRVRLNDQNAVRGDSGAPRLQNATEG